MKLLRFACAALFAWAAWLQMNDPDTLPWMLLYGGAALACLRPTPIFSLTLVLTAGAWAWRLYERLQLEVPLSEALADWGMHAQGSEEAREIGGLLLVGVTVSAFAIHRRLSR